MEREIRLIQSITIHKLDTMNPEKVTDYHEKTWLTWQEAEHVLPDGNHKKIWYPKCSICEEEIKDRTDLYLHCPTCKSEYCIDCFDARKVGIKFRCTSCVEWVCDTCTLVCRNCDHTYCDDCFNNPDNYFGENICKNCTPTTIENNDGDE